MTNINSFVNDYLIILEQYLYDFLHNIEKYQIDSINQFEDGKYSVVIHFLNENPIIDPSDLLKLLKTLGLTYNLKSVNINQDLTLYISLNIPNETIDILVQSLPAD